MSNESHNVRNGPTAARPKAEEAEDDRAPTIRTTPVDVDLDALPDQVSQYVAPQPLPRVSEHKTIDMVPVRLAPEVNPRRALTRRLETAPPADSRRVYLVVAAAALLFAALVFGLMRLSRGAAADPESVSRAKAASDNGSTTPVVSAAAAMAAPAATVVKDETGDLRSAPIVPPPPSARTQTSSRPATKTDSKGKQVWLE